MLFFLQSLTNCFGGVPASAAFVNIFAASSNAPPNLGPIVSKPEHNEEIKSFPARAATTVLCAPETAGPWSAQITKHISRKRKQVSGSFLRNHSKEMAPPTPIPSCTTLLIGIPE